MGITAPQLIELASMIFFGILYSGIGSLFDALLYHYGWIREKKLWVIWIAGFGLSFFYHNKSPTPFYYCFDAFVMILGGIALHRPEINHALKHGRWWWIKEKDNVS